MILKNSLILFLFLLISTSCKVEDSVVTPEPSSSFISKIAEYQTGVLEPSGLTLGKNNKTLWTVSDNTNNVYQLDLKGNILKEVEFNGNDLEGITFDTRDGTLWLAEEELRELVHIDTNGTELGRFNVTNLEGSGNSGLEGICLDTAFTKFVLNEKSPRLWAKLNSGYSAEEIKKITAVQDLSGIWYEPNGNFFWIVSDQSKKLFQWSPNKGVIQSADLDYSKAEGVTVDEARKIVYIVSDKTGKLYLYKINEQ